MTAATQVGDTMKRFAVYFHTADSSYVEVKANSKTEAREKVENWDLDNDEECSVEHNPCCNWDPVIDEVEEINEIKQSKQTTLKR
jgi:hypothetical protein